MPFGMRSLDFVGEVLGIEFVRAEEDFAAGAYGDDDGSRIFIHLPFGC